MELVQMEKIPLLVIFSCLTILIIVYLVRLNSLLRGTPEEIARISPTRWTEQVVLETYARLTSSPLKTSTYKNKIPPRLDRRYVVTGGSGESMRPL